MATQPQTAAGTGEPYDDGPIIVFDALCVLCSTNAQFILKHDRRGHFRLASMQGDVGAALFRRCGIDPADPESFVIVEGDTVLRNSDAVLAIYDGLGGAWRALTVFRIIPRFLRDRLYLLVARNRYRIFGRRETCWVPSPEQAGRIL
ncbi:thiol-disulfide oxidoreductase DCC family protein [Roseibium aggregatum]|uniref:Thiol-disulfide oxidoreductase DCC family protein n=1 Tax=Roseibium aggregatum TaxID=187304 RepID=A0A926SAA8_9HYPH|nr:thiol-disulfide oxidoreductase DCC family protein [Roseibium aggregatum]MBD1548664.1 thiol-disulfide oxidoreductase DCC family protein [Roseibium aggregatum]